jgi:hypothetical protein
MDNRTTWFRAQLDDDERVALEATGDSWQPHERYPRGVYAISRTGNPALVAEVRRCGPDVSEQQIKDHITRWNPKRAVDEVDAKRRILERHAPVDDGLHYVHCKWCSTPQCGVYQPWPCPDLLDAAAPYADRPGYREEWRP